MKKIYKVIIGTSGHVDHGKTSLVKLLTGVDTDTLPEEKKRGMTINLGFTFMSLNDGGRVGIIDVPGHEDFIKNMIAGASSIDILLLVTAADDGIMPQTVEHLSIVSILKDIKVISVISKADLASAEEIVLLKDELTQFFKKYGFHNVPIIPFSAITQRGLEEIREAIELSVHSIKPRNDKRSFRMNIARVFSAKGYGTIVTGIPISGSVKAGDTLTILPASQECIVRGIQGYRENLPEASAGMCSALNLKKIPKDDVERGMSLVAPSSYLPSHDFLISLFNSTDDYIFPRISEHLFMSGTSKSIASVRLIGKIELNPREKCYARILTRSNLPVFPGDACLLRGLTPSVTIGGGYIYTSNPPQKRRELTDELLSKGDDAFKKGEFFLSNLILSRFFFITPSSELNTGFSYDVFIDEAKRLEGMGELSPMAQNSWAITFKMTLLARKITDYMKFHSRTNPSSSGVDLIRMVSHINSSEVVCPDREVLFNLISPFMEMRYDGRVVSHLKDPIFSKDEELLFKKILKICATSGFNAAASGTICEKLEITSALLSRKLERFESAGLLRRCGNFVISEESYRKIRGDFLALFANKEFLTLEDIREVSKGGRHFLIALLESFDSDGVTVRCSEGRKKLN